MIQIFIPKQNTQSGFLDLYESETLSLEVKNKDLKDIEKAMSDFVRTFTIPMTSKNSSLLGNSLDLQVSTMTRSQYVRAVIYLNGIEFKKGMLEVIEKKVASNSESYLKVNFFTGITELKELVGDDTLDSLPINRRVKWDVINASTLFTRGMARAEYGNDDVLLAMVSKQRHWSALSGEPNNITAGGTTGAVKYSEIPLILKVNTIMEAIYAKYFTSNNIKPPVFKELAKYKDDLYIYLNGKRKETSAVVKLPNNTPYSLVGINAYTLSEGTQAGEKWVNVNVTNQSDFNKITRTGMVIKLYGIRNMDSFEVGKDEVTLSVKYKNNVNISFATGKPNNDGYLRLYIDLQDVKTFGGFRLELSSDVLNNCSRYEIEITSRYSDGSLVATQNKKTQQVEYMNNGETNRIDVRDFLGDIKVIDFIKELAKMFNASVVPDDEGNIFFLTPKEVENFVKQSHINRPYFDISKYVDRSSIVTRLFPKYKDFNLTYKEAKYYRNKAYKSLTGREYGAVYFKTGNKYAKDSYSVEVNANILPYFVLEGTRNFNTSYLFEETGSVASGSLIVFLMAGNDYRAQTIDGNPLSVKLDHGDYNFEVRDFVKLSNISRTGLSLTFENEVNENGAVIKNTLYKYYRDSIETITNPYRAYKDISVAIDPSFILLLNFGAVFVLDGVKHKIEEATIDLTTGRGKMTIFNIE